MNKKRNWLEAFGDFISGKGFYLVVLVCVAAIALSGFYLVQGIRGTLEDVEDQPVSGTANITESAAPSSAPAVSSSARPQNSDAPSQQPSAEATAPALAPSTAPSVAPSAAPSEVPTMATPAPTTTPAALVFTWPVNGTVIADFSVEVLAYDVTMGDWRTHQGLDIAVDLGTKVEAAASGTVSAIYEDDLMGTVLVIDHGNGLTSMYSNLAAEPTVAVGDTVITGAVIGSVGSTAAAESGRANHLHFAMYQDNVAIDPKEYLP